MIILKKRRNAKLFVELIQFAINTDKRITYDTYKDLLVS